MNIKNIFFTIFIFAIALGKSISQDVYFATYPCLSPDAKFVVYSYEGDIWKTDVATGQSARITAMTGIETRPIISPDGQWLTFTSNQYGNPDIFVVSMEGGDIKQLTYHDSPDLVECWSWDSKMIYFKNSSQNQGTVFSISKEGGTPKRIFPHYFNRLHNIAISPSGEIFFNDTGESDSQAFRKGYKGAYNPEIQSYHPKTGVYKKYTDHPGKDMWTSIDSEGVIYYASDEIKGQYNLFSNSNGVKKMLTTFDVSIKHPRVSANGQKVVFEKDYQLWVYDISTRISSLIPLKASRNFTLPKDQEFEIKGNITYFDVSPDGKKMAFASRGELFISDIEGKFIKQLKTSKDGRVQEVKWIDDQKVMFSQTVGGYPNWFVIAGDGKSVAQQLTNDKQSNRHLSLNSKRTKAIYVSGRSELKIMDLPSFAVKTLLKDEFWAIQSEEPSFSPDDAFVMYGAYRNFEKDIFICRLSDGSITNLTNTGVTESSARWSPDGKYIYFASDRFQPNYPFGSQNVKLFRIPTTKADDPFRMEKFDKLWVKDTKDSTSVKNSDMAKGDSSKSITKKASKDSVSIDAERFMERMEAVGPNFGEQRSPYIIQKDDKTTVLYISNHDEGKSAMWKTVFEPFGTTKTEKIEDTRGVDIVSVDGKHFILTGGNIKKLNGDISKSESIDMSFTFFRNISDEFHQMFYETWAGVGENFYSEDYHGANWDKLQAYYSQFLPFVNSRTDYKELMQDMLGELNSSHTGFSSSGNEEKVFYKNITSNIGIIFDNENPYVVNRVIARGPSDKHDVQIRQGDVLVRVNDETVDANANRDIYFTGPELCKELTLTFRRGNEFVTAMIHPVSTGSMVSDIYEEWVDRNQKQVDEMSRHKIAYVHMRNMTNPEFEKFYIDMTQDFYQKDALIFDLRYNTGGNVHDKVLSFLSQKPYLQWKYREGALTSQPNFGPAAKPIVLLINEQSLSDAEMTASGFKSLGLGKIIGTETYRWIIFTSGKGLVDGSFYRLPSWGCYTLDGQNLEKTGVTPDIFVPQTFKDRLNDQDPQIERAVSEILNQLKTK
ncbi:MAG: S41 family peptidase [Saprospiraceae bacterium]